MNKTIFSLLSIILLLNMTYAITIYDPCLILGNCYTTNNDLPEINVNLEKSVFYIEAGEDFDVEFEIINTGDKEGLVLIQLQPDEDEDDEIYGKKTSKEITIQPNDTITLNYGVEVTSKAYDDEYKIPFKIITYYYDDEEYKILDEITKKITIHVDDFEDSIDVSLEENRFCVNNEAPFNTYLIFENEENNTFYIDPDVDSSELWVKVKSDIIEIQDDDEVKVPLIITKAMKEGEYELTIDTDVYKDEIYGEDKITFKKKFKVYFEDCDETNTNLYLKQTSATINKGNKLTINFNIYNYFDEDIVANLYAKSTKGVNVNFSQKNFLINDNRSVSGTITLDVSEVANTGLNLIEIYMDTPYASTSKTFNLTVLGSDLEINADTTEIPLGILGFQNITITNNSNEEKTIYIYPVSNNSDIISVTNTTNTIDAGESKTIKIKIIPKELGNKTYKLILSGDVSKEQIINYSSNTSESNTDIVKSYNTKLNPLVNEWNTLKVDFVNPYNVDLTVSFLVSGLGIESKTSKFVLSANQTRTIAVEYKATENTNNAYLTITTDLGTKNYPMSINLKYDESNPNNLVIRDLPTEIPFNNGNKVSKTFIVYNPNNFSVNGKIALYTSDNLNIGEKAFTIPANSEKEIIVDYTINSAINLTGTLNLYTNNILETYEVAYVQSLMFSQVGLFGLGFGNTMGIIFGVLIAIGIVIYLFASKKVVLRK